MGSISSGNLKNPRSQRDMLAMMSGYYDTRVVTIGADDVVLGASYAGMVCIGIRNESAANATVYYTTQVQPLVANKKEITIATLQHSGLMPPLHTICGTGNGSTAATITLYFYNVSN
jgi:hypothetical protein